MRPLIHVNRITLIYAFVSLCACSPNKENRPNSDLSSSIIKKDPILDSAKLRLMKIIEGGWVKKEYTVDLLRTHSPFLSFAHTGNEVEFRIDISQVEGDTIINSKGMLNYHEGARFEVVLEGAPGRNVLAHIYQGHNWEDDSFYLDYVIDGIDTTLFLCEREGRTRSEKSRIAYKRAFRTVPDDDPPVNAIEFLLNKALFSGKYELQDALSNNCGQVIFDNRGGVRGLSDFKKYKVNADFDGSSYPKFDFVDLYNLGDHSSPYAFEWHKNAISLYEMISNPASGIFRKGALKYTLKRT
jgi:hypothetical protein